MDKKNLIFGVALLLVGGIMLFLHFKENEAYQKELARYQAEHPQVVADDAGDAGEAESGGLETPLAPAGASPDATMVAEAFVTLENEAIVAEVSTHTGAIRTVTLKEYPEQNPRKVDETTPVVLNEGGLYGMLALSYGGNNKFGGEVARGYTIIEQSPLRVVLESQADRSLKVRRTYQLAPGNEGAAPYVIHATIDYQNTDDLPRDLGQHYLHIGTAAPTESDPSGQSLAAGYYDAKDNYHMLLSQKFRSGGFFSSAPPPSWIRRDGGMKWGAVKNQFFTTIATPTTAATAFAVAPRHYPADPETGAHPTGIAAALEFALPTLEPHGTHSLEVDLYTGPKDFSHLEELDPNQDVVLQLGWFLNFSVGLIAFIASGLLKLLEFYQGFLGSWGFAIIAATLTVRLLMLPLTAKAARSAKRMQELSEPMKAAQKKYADDPQRLQQEMAALFKKHKVTPLSGCWPVLIQFPIFIAFFNLLRNASELRYANFLWITDLSMADHTFHLPFSIPLLGEYLNVLPFFWLISMVLLMKFTPTPPNADDNPAYKIMKYMPFIFFVPTYGFSSGLVLYWTVTNTFSIFQGWYIRQHKDREDVAIEAEIVEASGKPVKPGKKK